MNRFESLRQISLRNLTFIAALLQLVFAASTISQVVPDENDVRLFFYPDSNNVSTIEELHLLDSTSFENESLTRGKRAKILVHGANGNCKGNGFPLPSIEAYLRAKASGKEDYNVFCVDYEPLGRLPYSGIPGNSSPSPRQYYEYVVNIVGNKTARFILALEEHGVVSDLGQIHLIGHSLGGQSVGVVGLKVLEMTSYQKQLGRITGLDVMNIYNFNVYRNELNLRNQIDRSDAQFVDIIHTNDGQVGLRGDYGHLDVYPDGGEHQNACLQSGGLYDLIERLTGSCSHGIVGQYWVASIENPNITACKADSYQDFKQKLNESTACEGENIAVVGEYASTSTYGKFYLDVPQSSKSNRHSFDDMKEALYFKNRNM